MRGYVTECVVVKSLRKLQYKTMQHDELIWQVIGNDGFCSFKAKTKVQTFCRNSYNLTGMCSRKACPLGNSRYATVIEKEGVIYLYVKVVERAHSPASLWEKIALPANYAKAVALISKHLEFWPGYIQNKCKQRLTKIHQYLIRMRKMQSQIKLKLVSKTNKIERRELVREHKALKAAKIDEAIKAELLQRLSQGTYGEIYNFPQRSFIETLDENEEQVESEMEEDDENEDEYDQEAATEFVEMYDSDILSGDEQDSDDSNSQTIRTKPIIEIEYEKESAIPAFNY